MARTCFYCGLWTRFAGTKVERATKSFDVPAFDDGYEYREREVAHPTCFVEHDDPDWEN